MTDLSKPRVSTLDMPVWSIVKTVVRALDKAGMGSRGFLKRALKAPDKKALQALAREYVEVDEK